MTALAVPVLAWLVSGAAFGGTAGIERLVTRLPADDPKVSRAVMRSLVKSGAAGLADLTEMLAEPGKGDDAQARYALHGLAVWLASPGNEAAREEFAGYFAAEAKKTVSPAKREFLIRQLLWIGGPATVRELADLITDEALGGCAIDAILAVRPQGNESLLAALARARGENRIRVIQALGVLRVREAVPALEIIVEEEYGQVTLSALEALGNIGAAGSSKLLLRAGAAAEPGYEKGQATKAVLLYARRLAEGGDRTGAAEVYRAVWKKRAWRKDLHARIHALRGLTETAGTAALGDLMKALDSRDLELRAAAVKIAIAAPGRATTEWLVKQAATVAPEIRVSLLAILGRRGDAAAVFLIEESLAARAPEVRAAAAAALGRLAGDKAVPSLVGFLKSEHESDRKAAGDALLWIDGPGASAAVAAALDGAPAESQEVLLEILGARGADAHLGKVIHLARKGATAGTRAAALTAAGRLGSFENLPVMLAAVLAAADDGERSAARESFVAICGRLKDRDPGTRLLLKAVSGSSDSARIEILAALPDLGGEPALAAARQELAHENVRVREAAVRALAGWSDDAPAPDLLEVARDSSEEKHRILALRGYVRMAKMARKRPPEETVQMYELAWAAARRTEDKKLVLSGLGQVGHPSALTMAEKHFADKTVRDEACAAAVGIVRGMRGVDPDKAQAVIARVLEIVEAKAVRKKAKAALEYFEKYGDYITAWLVSGDYRKEGLDREKLLDTAFAPEKDGAKNKGWWRPKQDPESEEPWIVDLNEALWWSENCVGYLKTQVWSPVVQDAVLEIGSDDGIKVWLNGKEIHANNAWRGVEPGDDKVDVTLEKGWNPVMMKVTQGGGDWGVCARFRSPGGERLSGVRIKPE